MDVGIRTDHVVMCPEWHHMIHEWVERCSKHHPSVDEMDVTLRYGGRCRSGEVEAVASTRGRRLRAATRSRFVSVALHDALVALEQELLVHESLTLARGSAPRPRRAKPAGAPPLPARWRSAARSARGRMDIEDS